MLHSFFWKVWWKLKFRKKKKSQQTDCDSGPLYLRSLLSFHEELKTNVIFPGNTGNSWHASLLSCLQPLSFFFPTKFRAWRGRLEIRLCQMRPSILKAAAVFKARTSAPSSERCSIFWISGIPVACVSAGYQPAESSPLFLVIVTRPKPLFLLSLRDLQLRFSSADLFRSSIYLKMISSGSCQTDSSPPSSNFFHENTWYHTLLNHSVLYGRYSL